MSTYSMLNQSSKSTKTEIRLRAYTRDVVLSCPWQGMQSMSQVGVNPSPPPGKQLQEHLLTWLPPQGPFVYLPLSISIASGDSSGWVGKWGEE